MANTAQLESLVDFTAKLHAVESEVDRWERVLDHLFVGAWETWPNGEIKWLSTQGLTIMAGPDATLEDFKGANWVKRIYKEDRERVVQHWTNCLRNRIEFMSVHRLQWDNGHIETLFFYGRCNSRGWVGTIIPVTPVVELSEDVYKRGASNVRGT